MNNIIDRALKKRNDIYKVYTVIFLCLCVMCFGFHIISGKTFIWNSDGWNQHYKALIYYAQYLRNIIKTLLTEFRVVIPQWDFNIGEGSDIIQTLHYYVIGDPFSILCFLVPTEYMHVYFDLAVIIRIYTAGLVFITLLRYEGINNGYAILAGVINYCFCQYIFCLMTYHPYFLNPMFFLPLIVLGVEKILYERNYTCMLLAIAMAALSNFYFFYVYTILIAVYVFVRMFTFGFQRNINRFQFLGRVICTAFFGVLMSSVIFLPVMYSFVNDSRLGTDNRYNLFYPLEYYLKLPKTITSSGVNTYELFFGVSSMAVLTMAYLFIKFIYLDKNKKIDLLQKNPIPWLVIIGSVFVIFPFFGQLMNGLTYRCNRWSFALVLLVSYIVAKKWDDIMMLNRDEGIRICIILFIYLIFCFFVEQSRDVYVLMETSLSIVMIVFLMCSEMKSKQAICLGIVILSVFVSSCYRFSFSGTAACEEREGINYRLRSNEASAIRALAEEDNVNEPYRYAAFSPTINAGMLEKLSSTNFFFSNANPYHVKYEKYMGVSNDMDFYHIDYNERDTLLEMASVRYFATKYEEMVPYNYGFKTSFEDWKGERWNIYENAFPLGLTYSYPLDRGYISQSTWLDYTETLRQEAMLKYPLLNEAPVTNKSEDNNSDLVSNVREAEFSFAENNDGIKIEGNRIFVLKDNAILTIMTDSKKDRLLYLNIEGVSQEKLYDYDLYHKYKNLSRELNVRTDEWNECKLEERIEMIEDKYIKDDTGSGSAIFIASDTGKGRTVSFANPDSSWYSGRNNCAVDLGYMKEDESKIYLRFVSKGIYTVDSIKVYNIDRTGFETDVSTLSQIKIENLNMEDNTINGEIKCDEDRLLCLSIPFLKGWSVYIDGEKTDLLNTNILYMGVMVPKGEHRVLLCYHTPFLRLGCLISVLSWLIFGLYCFNHKKMHQ